MSNQAKRRTGLHPLSYMGVEPITPPLLIIETRQPTTEDSKNVNVGALWVIRSPNEVWMLVDISGNVATWVQLYPGAGGGATSFPCDVGVANEAGGVLNVIGSLGGGGLMATGGSGNTIEIELGNGSNGQVLIGGGAFAVWQNITSTGGTVAITNAANSINIETVGGQGVDNVVTDFGIATPDIAGTLNVVTGSSLILETTGAGNTVTTDFDNTQHRDGEVLIGITAAGDPAWANITSAGGTISIINGANAINLETVGTTAFYSFSAYQDADAIYGPAPEPSMIGLGSFDGVTLTELTDPSNSFYPGDGAGTGCSFTVPINGTYLFSFQLGGGKPFANPWTALPIIVTPTFNFGGFFNVGISSPYLRYATAVVPLNAGEVVTFEMHMYTNVKTFVYGQYNVTLGTGIITLHPTIVYGHLL